MDEETYRLSEDAIRDIDSIWLYLLRRDGIGAADRIVTEFFKTFQKLSEMPNIGHRRADLTSKNVLFYRAFSYLIIYEIGSKPVPILAVIHGKRRVDLLLRNRE